MIVGVGVDIVDLARFERALSRTPRLAPRLFTDAERVSGDAPLPLRSLAGRFAAKEALIKALGGSAGIGWHDMRVIRDDDRNPAFAVEPPLQQLLNDRGIRRIHLSMAHDAGVAIAYVVTET
ncbi:holo-ACP synthase [Lysobacter korlensis]|uniref:Holo-[acyl-carrier-protein] synthase n=1 Tax=Lysobacter korlensis TaxID=553636 RepID=A0ABV6RW00_9GAMM